MQSISVEGFYQVIDKAKGIRESSRQVKERLSKQLSQDLDEIDEVYDAIDIQEKKAIIARAKKVVLQIDED